MPRVPGEQGVSIAREVSYLNGLDGTALEGKPHQDIIINRSSGGVALLVDHDFALEEILFVRVLEAPQSVPVVQVKVRHSRRAGHMHMLGCQYCHELPWNVKVWFG